MKVKEIIEKLQSFPQDLPCKVWCPDVGTHGGYLEVENLLKVGEFNANGSLPDSATMVEVELESV